MPKLRFPGFGEPWKKCKLGEVADIVGGGTPNTSIPEFWDGNIDWYAPAEIYNQIYVSSSKRKITKQGYENSSTKLLPVGTVLFTSRAGIGKTAILAKEGCTNQGFQSIVPHNDKLDSYFIFSRTEELKNYGELVGAGSTFVEVSGRQMSNMPLIMPSTIEEQQTIGEYFKHFDNFITLHQQKVDTLKKYKRGLLQKMFPRNGAKVPEIRFPGFTGDWKQRKFDSITFPSGEKNRSNLPYESYSVTNENGFIPQNEQFENGGTMATADKSMYYIVSKNSFAYNPARINVGSIGYYEKPENVIVSSLYEVFKTTEDIDDRFLWHWFKSDTFQKMIEQYQEGGVRLYFYYDKLCMCSLSVPSIQEQRKIGKQLDAIDRLITLHQRKLDSLQQYKKGLLQQMFI